MCSSTTLGKKIVSGCSCRLKMCVSHNLTFFEYIQHFNIHCLVEGEREKKENNLLFTHREMTFSP